MIFQHTWRKVLSGEKTQTRRLVKHDHMIVATKGIYQVKTIAINALSPAFDADYMDCPGRAIYEIGKTYAVQPSRTAKSIARIRITDIRREDVRRISYEDACAEGFKDKDPAANEADTIYGGFLKTWCKMHDKRAVWEFDPQRVDYWINTGKRRELVGFNTVKEIIASRPTELYQAWVLTFELVKV